MELDNLKSKASLLELTLIDAVERATYRKAMYEVIDRLRRLAREMPPPSELNISQQVVYTTWFATLTSRIAKEFSNCT